MRQIIIYLITSMFRNVHIIMSEVYSENKHFFRPYPSRIHAHFNENEAETVAMLQQQQWFPLIRLTLAQWQAII